MVVASGNDTYTKSLLHFDGNDQGATFTDSAIGGSAHVWTPGSTGAKTVTGQSEFGGAAGAFNGTGAWIDTTNHSDFNPAAGNFTLDFWAKMGVTGATFQSFYARRTSAGPTGGGAQKDFFGVAYSAASRIRFTSAVNTVVKGQYTATYSPGTSVFHHYAFVRDGATFYIFIDGNPQALTTDTAIGTNDLTFTYAPTADLPSIGRYGNYTVSYWFNGWIDEFRFSKGIARWTATFTPPVAEYGQGLTASYADTITLSESRTSKPKPVKTDILTLSDSRTSKPTLIKTDILSLVESISKKPTAVKADSMSLSEAIVKIPKQVKADSISLSESIVKKPRVLKADSITILDALVKSLHIKKTDIMSLTDSISKKFGLHKSDIITLLDFFSYVLTTGGITLSLSDSMHLSDVIKKSPHLFKSDALIILDQAIKQPRLKKQDFIFILDSFLKSARPAAGAVFDFVHKKRMEYKGELGGDFGFIQTKGIIPEGETGGDFRFEHKKRSKN
jgi:hypothetical protein